MRRTKTTTHTSQSDYETVFTNAKAGMDGVDKDKVKQIVYEMSKGSAHFANEQRKEAQVMQRIERMKGQAAKLTPTQLQGSERAADGRIASLEATRDLSKTWLHIDMDAFYAAVETLDDPSLASKPMAVGGMGMISTANYVARTFGVRSAMPGFIARKLCPELLFVKPDFEKYTKASHVTRGVFAIYDPKFMAGSLDEAYLDVTAVCLARGITGIMPASKP
ncbi:hypothetical protein CYMTET_48263 [Cymbomonas tetramitiformis]|uniref:UmuC domain-containing protein n=1 Tax=Cymbomonas tetramitiformis TaxID=36881 RepID=A0AAE0BSL6_9CHLO|nr:hypothetical protein CYMTET_48263 [Cymbomonas tetramitiformis]